MSNTANLGDIVSNAGPIQPTQPTTQAQPSAIGGTASLGDIVSNDGPSYQASQQFQPTVSDRMWEGAKQSAIGQGLQGAMNVLEGPKSSDEQVVLPST